MTLAKRATLITGITLRTLDALHLATIEFLRRQGETVELASYDNRLVAAAESVGIPVAAL
jgi:predicted nucleic acid-binding protein